MALTKTIQIDGQDVTFRASAAIPRIYRIKFGRDIYQDLNKLQAEVTQNEEGASFIEISSLEMFENIAYVMAKHADPTGVPDDIGDWLNQFETFSIYQILPEILTLWGANVETQVESRKNLGAVSGK